MVSPGSPGRRRAPFPLSRASSAPSGIDGVSSAPCGTPSGKSISCNLDSEARGPASVSGESYAFDPPSRSLASSESQSAASRPPQPSAPTSQAADPLEPPPSAVSSKDTEAWRGLLMFLNKPACTQEVEGGQTLDGRQSCASSLLHWCCRYARRLQAGCSQRRQFHYLLVGEDACAPPRNAVGWVVLSPAVQAAVMCIIFFDMCVFVYKLILNRDAALGKAKAGDGFTDEQHLAFLLIDYFVLATLGLEVLGRIFYWGPRYTHSLLNLLEAALVPLMVAEIALSARSPRAPGGGGGRGGGAASEVELGPPAVYRTARPIIKAVGLLGRAARGASHAVKLRRTLQEQVAGGHRRFVSDGFDLDLCYVVPDRLVAMGRPETGRGILYNNSLQEISRFFNRRHTNRYLVINATLAEEFSYSRGPLNHRVMRFPFPAFGVPRLSELWELCNAMQDFMDRDEENVCAVHGFSDSGRAGLVVAAWLLFSGQFRQAASALGSYERARTAVGAKELVHGVDCASQRRYLDYFCACAHELRECPEPPRRVRLKSIRVLGLDLGDTASLSVRVFQRTPYRTPFNELMAKMEVNEGEGGSAKGSSVRSAYDSNNSLANSIEQAMADDLGTIYCSSASLEVDDVVQQEASMAHENSVGAGCTPQPGVPLVDTLEGSEQTSLLATATKVSRSDPGVAAWDFEDAELSGEVCFEFHAMRPGHPTDSAVASGMGSTDTAAAGAPPAESSPVARASFPDARRYARGHSFSSNATSRSARKRSKFRPARQPTCTREEPQMLFAAWFHTSFLEVSQSMGLRHTLDDKTVGVVLRRGDVDKARGAPGLQGGAASFQVKLLFEVDEPMDTRPRCPVARRSKKTDQAQEAELFRLHPPSEQDVSSPEDLGWLTWCVGRLWPYTEAALEKLIRETVEPLLQEFVPKSLRNVHFSDCTLGATPEFGKVIASQRHDRGDTLGLQLDIGLQYKGPINVVVDVGIAKVGVNNIDLTGILCVLFDPIVKELPIIGGLQIFFLNPPKVVLSYVGLAELVNYSFKSAFQGAIDTAVASSLVLPNVLSINWMSDRAATGEPTCWLSSTLPTGVLRVSVLEAKGVGGDLKTYCVVKLGAVRRRTEKSRRAVSDPKWNQTFDLILHDTKQLLTLEVCYQDMAAGEGIEFTTEGLEVQSLLRRSGPKWIALEPSEDRKTKAGYTIRHSLGTLRSMTKRSSTLGQSSVAGTRVKIDVSLFELVADKEIFSRDAVGAPLVAERPGALSPRRGSKQSAPLPNALLVCKVVKGRIPPGKVQGSTLHVSSASAEDERKLCAVDDAWLAQVGIDESKVSTIGVLTREGFDAEKIARVLKMERSVVHKVMAHCLSFNVELPQHLCVPVAASGPTGGGDIRLEVRRKGKCDAKGTVPVQSVLKAPSMHLVRTVAFQSTAADGGESRYSFEVDLQLLAFAASEPEGGPRSQQQEEDATQEEEEAPEESGSRTASGRLAPRTDARRATY